MHRKAIALKADVDGNNATITATVLVLVFMSFTYSTNPYANAEVFDAETGASLGTTDANGKATVAIPASGKIAVGGWAAIAVKGTAAPAPGDDAPAPAPETIPRHLLPETNPCAGTRGRCSCACTRRRTCRTQPAPYFCGRPVPDRLWPAAYYGRCGALQKDEALQVKQCFWKSFSFK